MIGILAKLSVLSLFLALKTVLATATLIFRLGITTSLRVNKKSVSFTIR